MKGTGCKGTGNGRGKQRGRGGGAQGNDFERSVLFPTWASDAWKQPLVVNSSLIEQHHAIPRGEEVASVGACTRTARTFYSLGCNYCVYIRRGMEVR